MPTKLRCKRGQRLKIRVFHRDGNQCQRCGGELNIPQQPKVKFATPAILHHLEDQATSVNHALENLMLTCENCEGKYHLIYDILLTFQRRFQRSLRKIKSPPSRMNSQYLVHQTGGDVCKLIDILRKSQAKMQLTWREKVFFKLHNLLIAWA